jgi:hypothetical protein
VLLSKGILLRSCTVLIVSRLSVVTGRTLGTLIPSVISLLIILYLLRLALGLLRLRLALSLLRLGLGLRLRLHMRLLLQIQQSLWTTLQAKRLLTVFIAMLRLHTRAVS